MHLRAPAFVAVLAAAAAARAQPAPTATPEPLPPPPAHRSPFVYLFGFGVGAAHVDPSGTSCPACDVSPLVLDVDLAVGARFVPRLAIGAALDVQIEFVNGLEGHSNTLDTVIPYVWGGYDVTDDFQLVGGVGYASATYQWKVTVDDLFGSHDEEHSDHIGAGPVLVGAARFALKRVRSGLGAVLEVKATAARVGSAGTVPSLALDVMFGKF